MKKFKNLKLLEYKLDNRIVYHGTDYKKLPNYYSYYFTDNEKYAKWYGKYVIKAYLKVIKPFVIKWDIDKNPLRAYDYISKDEFICLMGKINKKLILFFKKYLDHLDGDDEFSAWEIIEDEDFVIELKKLGYDSIFAIEKGNNIFVVFDKKQISVVE